MTPSFIRYVFVVTMSFLPLWGYAGGPFVIDSVGKTGTVQQWSDTTLVWYSDDGPLSKSVNNATGKSWVQDAFTKWQAITFPNAAGKSVGTVNVTVTYGGSIGKDIDATNFGEYTSAEPGKTVVIFDADGSILKSILHVDTTDIVGISGPLLSNADGTKILKGFALFNGSMLEANRLSSDPAKAQELFRATIFHELGHLLNLDHSQVNLAIAKACTLSGTCTDGQYIPAMFPELKTVLQGDPARDDKITLSWIYPTSAFQNDFCVIKGRVEDEKGKPLRGVNVIASRVGDGDSLTKQDARAMVSGVLYPLCSNDSQYFLYGITPGKIYQVTYEPLDEKYTGQSGFEPLSAPPSGFDSGTIPGPDGVTTVSCSTGGETITMETVQIKTNNPCTTFTDISSSNGGTTGGSGPSSSSSGGCSLAIQGK